MEYTVKTGENKNGDFMKHKENVLVPLSEYKEEFYGDIKKNAVENGRIIKEAFKGSFDIVVKKGYCNGKCVVFANCDGLTNAQRIADYAIKPLLTFQGELPEENLLDFMGNHIIYGTEQKQIKSLDEAMKELLRGTLLIFVEGEKSRFIRKINKNYKYNKTNYEVFNLYSAVACAYNE